MSEYKNIKTKKVRFVWRNSFQIGLKKFLWLKKVKITVPLTYVISNLNSEEILVIFSKEELPRTNQREFRIEKVIKRKDGKLYVKWKSLIKTMSLYILIYFSEPYTSNKSKIKVELDLPNYVTKSDLKNTTGVDRSNFAKSLI